MPLRKKGKKMAGKNQPANTVEIVAKRWPNEGFQITHFTILARFKAYGETFVVHRSMSGDGFTAAHLGTGGKCTMDFEGQTIASAIKAAKRRLRRNGPEALRQGLRKVHKENLRRKRLMAQEPAK